MSKPSISSMTAAELVNHLGDSTDPTVQSLMERVIADAQRMDEMTKELWVETWTPVPDPDPVVASMADGYLPYLRLLPSLSIGDFAEGCPVHMLIEGSNLAALIALLPTHRGKIDCVYIDPDFYISAARGVPAELLPSLRLQRLFVLMLITQQLLSPKGVVLVHSNADVEADTRKVLDRVFGKKRFLTNFVWRSAATGDNRKDTPDRPADNADYIIAYRSPGDLRMRRDFKGERVYTHSDERGEYRVVPIGTIPIGNGGRGRTGMVFEILGVSPPKGRSWKTKSLDMDNVFLNKGKPAIRVYRDQDESGVKKHAFTYVREEDLVLPGDLDEMISSETGGLSMNGGQELASRIGARASAVSSVKPVKLIAHLIRKMTPDGDEVVLDYYGGSGTTIEAVSAINREDGGSRECIAVSLPDDDPVLEDEESEGGVFNAAIERSRAVITGAWAGREADCVQESVAVFAIGTKKPRGSYGLRAKTSKKSEMKEQLAVDAQALLPARVAIMERCYKTIESNHGALPVVMSNHEGSKIVIVWDHMDSITDSIEESLTETSERLSRAFPAAEQVVYLPVPEGEVPKKVAKALPGVKLSSGALAHSQVVESAVGRLVSGGHIAPMSKMDEIKRIYGANRP